MSLKLEAIATREALAIRSEAIASRLEAIPSRLTKDCGGSCRCQLRFLREKWRIDERPSQFKDGARSLSIKVVFMQFTYLFGQVESFQVCQIQIFVVLQSASFSAWPCQTHRPQHALLPRSYGARSCSKDPSNCQKDQKNYWAGPIASRLGHCK